MVNLKRNGLLLGISMLWLLATGVANASTLVQRSDFCSLYPIGLSNSVVGAAQPGQQFELVKTRSGPGNFSWLTWTGNNNVGQIAGSLIPPGDSQTYTNPNNSSDHKLDIGDWVQGEPGVKNARSVRDAMDNLIGQDIIVPVWSSSKNAGANYDYLVNKFAIIELTDYKLNGKGYLSFEFKRYTRCYNEPPVAEDISVEGEEDTPIPITLLGTDPDDDPLTYAVVQDPANGTFEIDGEKLIYTPNPSYVGEDLITYYADDGEAISNTATIDITIIHVNGPPEIISTPAIRTQVGEHYEYPVEAIDPDDDDLIYSLVISPSGMSIDENSGEISWSPEHTHAGVQQVTVQAADPEGLYDQQTYDIYVDPATKTYTVKSDFETGQLINVVADPEDRLQLSNEQRAFDFIWVAASARGTIVKIDTNTGEIKGEYYSAPNGRGRNPSRTTVDKNGNVWTGNRDEASGNSGSVVQIGLEENGECEDRNGNSIIDTSSGLGDILPWTNSGGADNNGGVSTAVDECVIGYVRVRGNNVRHVSVDSNNNVWVGGYYDHQFDLINGETRQIIASANPECGGYGGLVDPNGVVWSANRIGSYTLLRYDTNNTTTTADDEYRCIPVHDVYGLAFDQENDIWTTTPHGDAVYVLDNDGNITNYHNTQGGSGDTGMAISIATDNNVWIANRWGASISRLDQDGNVVAVIPVGSNPTGVAVDGKGKVWAANMHSNSVSRIDPTTNAVDLVVDLGAGAGPYNYSDMTGSTLTGAPEKGSWSVVYDSGYDPYQYGHVVWNSTVPGDAVLKVSVSSSQDGVNYSATQIIDSGKPLNIAAGRYLKIDVSFVRSSDGDSPVLYDLTVLGDSSACNTTNGCNNGLPVADAGQDKYIFVNDTFQLDGSSSNDPDQDPISYQWSLVAKPENSTISLNNGTSPQPSAAADVRGLYIYQLKVDDGKQTSLGDTVSVTVAQSVAVPDLAGMNQADAEEAVTSVELSVGITTLADSESVPKGLVVSQLPAAGTIVPVETSVNIVISRGAKPNITSTPPLQAWVSAEYTYGVDATDPDGTVVTYSLGVAPAGITIDGTTGVLSWTPAAGQEGYHEVQVFAVDQDNSVGQQEFVVQVLAENQPPTITSTPVASVVQGHQYSYQVAATDSEDTDLTYSLITLPSTMSVDSASGLISWNPQSTDVGSHPIVIRVYDSLNAFAEQSYTLVVSDTPNPGNHPPEITSTPSGSAVVGQQYQYVLVVTDPDNDPPNVTLAAAPEGMQLDGATQMITWTPTDLQVGNQEVSIQVSDGNFIITQTFTIIVYGQDGNSTPIIESTPGFVVSVGETYNYQVVATDADGDTLTYSLEQSLAGMSMNATGLVTWAPQASYIGTHTVAVKVGDQSSYITQTYSLTVTGDSGTPVITSTPTTQVTADDAYSYLVTATDPDNDPITLSLIQSPVGMSLNAATGEVTWATTQADLGSHEIIIQVEDNGGLGSQQIFTLIVVDNNTPIITSTPATLVEVDNTYSYFVTATDPDNDPITLSLIQSPAGMNLNASTGEITWVTTQTDLGSHEIILQVEDNGGLSSQQIFQLEVAQPNEPPEITSTPIFSGVVDFAYSYQVNATDPDGDTLSYSLITNPDGMSIDQAGLISWTPSATQAGNHSIVVRVSDGHYYAQQSYTLAISSEVPALAVDVAITPQTINIGDTVYLSVTASGGVAPAQLTLSIDGVEVALDAQDSAEYVTVHGGRHDVVVTADDGNSTTTSNTYFTVIDPSDTTPPEVSLTSPEPDSTISALADVIGTVQDDNLTNVMLVYKRVDSNQYVELYKGVDSFNAETIAQFDPSMLVNGIYTIILQAEDAGGNVAFDSITVTVEGDLKVGNFSFTVTDLEIPVVGIPIRINRTYDSRRRAEKLDFGHGWSIDYQNVRVEESRTPGKYWEINSYRYGPLNALTRFCVEPQGAPVVTVTLPDGDQEKFEVAASPSCAEMTVVLDVELDFKPVGDTQSTLVALNDNSGRLVNGHLVETSYFTYPLNPSRYQLTTREGYIYTLDQNFGVVQIITPNGQTLSYSDAGIIHSGGKSVLFNRDAEGKITSITDPTGNTLEYSYNSNDDLVAATDQTDATTSYTYNNNHGLLEIIDPLGRTLVKNIYDDDGRLIAQEDGNGNRTEFNHDIEGRFSLVTDRNGHNTQYYYDDEGNVLTQIDHLGNITSFTYDDRGNQLTQTDALGNSSSATYNASNDQLTQTDQLGNTVSFEYNTRGQETLITDARGYSYTNTYDSVGNLLTVTDPDGNIAGNNINAQGLPSNTVDALGNSTSFTYDGDGNKLTETDAEGNVASYSYDANGNLLTESRTRNIAGVDVTETTTHEYDERNRLITTTDALGNVTRTEYNLAGHESAKIDPLGNRTEMEYDLYGRLTETRYPDGNTETKSYGPEGNLLTETDRNGNTTTYEYDALNRQTRTTNAEGTSTQTEYDALGRVTAEIDELGNRTENEYDAAGRRILTRDAQGNEHRFEYDADGNLTAEIDALNGRTEHTYNALDQRITTTYHNASSVGVEFDAMSRRTGQTDQAGITTTYTYDSLGRLTKVTDAIGGETSYSYDEAGNKLTQTDAAGRTTSWSYDALGRVLTRTLPLGQVESFAYDANGNAISLTDFNGNTTTHQYDSNNRLIQSNFADGRVETYSYDANGNRVQVQVTLPDSSVEITNYSYDARNRLKTETQPDGTTLTYQYDAAGNRTQVLVTLPDSSTRTTDYSYDSMNRLQTVTDTSGITSYGYDAVGNRASISYPNGASQVYQYDDLNRLINLESYDGTGALVQSYAYTLHPTGRRTQIDEQDGRSTSYGYDDLYRLISETITDSINGNYSASYQYDAVGNRTYSTIDGVQTAYTYDANDRLAQQGGTTYSYDANGNTLTETLDSNTIAYSYDAKNQLIETDNAGTITGYSYNPDGIRTGKSEGAASTSYVVDSNRDYAQVLLDITNSTTNAAYTYGDDLISQTRSGTTSFYHYDGLGSTRALTDNTGTISDSYNYEAFGQALNQTGTTENDYLFTGEQYDSGLDQYYLRARYYDPSSARFTQMDSFQGWEVIPSTTHKYLYVSNDPANNIDPSGNFSLGSISAAMNISARLATIATPRVLNLGFSAVGRGVTTAVQAGTLVCLAQMVESLIGADLPKATMNEKYRGCEMNRMRVQLQQGRRFTIGKNAVATPNPGVTVNHVRAKLKQLYFARWEGGWFPSALDQWMYQSIVSLSIKLGRIPPNGVTGDRNILRKQTIYRGDNYRIDIENKRGHNLRR